MNNRRSMKPYHRLLFLFMLITILANCGKKESIENDQQTEKAVTELSPEEFKSKLNSTPDAVLIDVRKPEEVAEGMMEGAVNIDYTDSSFAQKIGELDKSKPYFVYCKSGKRSNTAAAEMEKLGFQQIYVLEGGYLKWLESGVKNNQ